MPVVWHSLPVQLPKPLHFCRTTLNLQEGKFAAATSAAAVALQTTPTARPAPPIQVGRAALRSL